MKYRNLISTILILSVLMPVSAFAATRRTDSESEEFSREVSNWRRGNSRIRDAVNDLDNDPVEDLPIPVLFGVAVRNLTRNFGDERGGGTRIHEGLDLMAAEGLPVVSPTDAVVIRIGDGASSGNYVSLAAPGEESFVFMHLSEVADIDEGDVLEPGDIVGYVGHTGNAIASAPHLHFEIHDENGDPTDPYPRLTKVFDLEDKIESLEQALDDSDDEEDLAELVVRISRSELTAAALAGIELPDEIIDALKTVPVTVSSGSVSLVLRVGSRGTAVKQLQEYLVKKDVGSASRVIPDGAFGPITRQAVIDYQASVGLSADGVAGPRTLSYIAAHP